MAAFLRKLCINDTDLSFFADKKKDEFLTSFIIERITSSQESGVSVSQ